MTSPWAVNEAHLLPELLGLDGELLARSGVARRDLHGEAEIDAGKHSKNPDWKRKW
jgi:hypothetical protein